MSEIGKTMDEKIAFELGVEMGAELKSIGVDMDMAPVLDIFSNPQNKVIADRAFGTNSEIVKKMAFAYADGLKAENIIIRSNAQRSSEVRMEGTFVKYKFRSSSIF